VPDPTGPTGPAFPVAATPFVAEPSIPLPRLAVRLGEARLAPTQRQTMHPPSPIVGHGCRCSAAVAPV